MSIANSKEFYFFFSNLNPFSFSSLIAVAKTSKNILDISFESGHPCLVPALRGNAFSFSSLRIVFAVSLLCMDFIMHWRRKWQPIPVFLPGESQRRGSLVASMGLPRVGHD